MLLQPFARTVSISPPTRASNLHAVPLLRMHARLMLGETQYPLVYPPLAQLLTPSYLLLARADLRVVGRRADPRALRHRSPHARRLPAAAGRHCRRAPTVGRPLVFARALTPVTTLVLPHDA